MSSPASAARPRPLLRRLARTMGCFLMDGLIGIGYMSASMPPVPMEPWATLREGTRRNRVPSEPHPERLTSALPTETEAALWAQLERL